jgi:hypothetical protein
MTPVIVPAPNGMSTLFVITPEGDVAFTSQREADSWTGWQSLGGTFVGRPAVSINGAGWLEVFARDGEGKLYHAWQTSGGDWSRWSP